MYSQNFQQNSFSNQAGAGFANTQNRGLATKYQPVGMVQSQYNQSLNNPSLTNQSFGTQQFASSQYSNYQNPQSFHTANYRGDQQGHDAYLRADSTQPAQFGTGFGASSYGTSIGSMNQNQYAQSQYASPQSFHSANYRGDQQGHDAYLRADSTQPTNSQFSMGASSFGNQFGASSASNWNQTANPSAQYMQATNPQSFHTANYRGNQQGHDAYLRADSVQPAQSQFGIGSMNRYQF